MEKETLCPGSEDLQLAFGGPSDGGFGSAVFALSANDAKAANASLSEHAKLIYQRFLGDAWNRFGAEHWLAGWKPAFTRQPGETPNVLSELKSSENSALRRRFGVLIEGHENPEAAQAALQATFNAPSISSFEVFEIGDNEAMSGLLFAAEFHSGGQVYLLFLLD